METKFDAETIFKCDEDTKLSIITQSLLESIPKNKFPLVREALDKMGELSAQAQDLKSVITLTDKFLLCPDQRIYLQAKNKMITGFLKTGVKTLFIRDKKNNLHEIKPLCVLDFYVHESQQRSGIGKALFELMLSNENFINPGLIAYDRPSPKLISFLAKHYSLTEYTPQNNNYVVFNDYFSLGGKGRKGNTVNKIVYNTDDDLEKEVNDSLQVKNNKHVEIISKPQKKVVSEVKTNKFFNNNNKLYNDNDDDMNYIDSKFNKIKLEEDKPKKKVKEVKQVLSTPWATDFDLKKK